MVSWVQIDDRGLKSEPELERLAMDVRCVRVGATQNRKARLADYCGRDSAMFITSGITYASMYFAYYKGYRQGHMKQMEQRLLDIAKGYGRGHLNKHRNSGYPLKYTQGYLYVILAERDIEQGLPPVAPSMAPSITPSIASMPSTPSYPERPQPDCFMTTRQKLIALAMFVIVCVIGFFVLFIML